MRSPLYIGSDPGVTVGPPSPAGNPMADMLRRGGFRATGLPLRQALGISSFSSPWSSGRPSASWAYGVGGGGFAGGGGIGGFRRRHGYAGTASYGQSGSRGAAPLLNPFLAGLL